MGNGTSPIFSSNYPTLNAWQQQLSPLQKSLIQVSWDTFLRSGKWALLRPMYREHGKSIVVQELSALPGMIFEEEDHQSGNRLSVLLPGVILSNDGPRYQSLIEKYYRFQHDLFKTESEIRQIKSEEIAARLELNSDDAKTLGYLLKLGNSLGGWVNDLSSWTVRTMTEAEDFPKNGELAKEVEDWFQKSYRPETPVFAEARLRKQLSAVPIFGNGFALNQAAPKVEPMRPTEGNPFKRRYQVFVSSTYIDLVEERKHVMQALLETKCIPSGMELFPAASMEQMKLIRSVIDDCDYYLVIVAGKYGSCGTAGTSYTEMEFDHAVSSGKPVLVFYHSDIKKLTGEKLEESDHARKKLATFTEKLKHQRLCRPWNTPDGLASAIKTAILHAIETNPKPGWVRTDSVPTWGMVVSLEQRIAELEGRPSTVSASSLPAGEDRININAKISWEEAEKPGSQYGVYHMLDKSFSFIWDDLFFLIAPKPGISTSRLGLLRRFGHSLAKQTENEIKGKSKNQILRTGGTIDGELFNQILQTFLAKKLLKQIPPPKRVRTRMLYWQLGPKGVQKLAELKAVKIN
jgi:hypothetical protein